MYTNRSVISGLILKDICNLKKSLKTLLLLFAFYGALSFVSQGYTLLITLAVVVSITLTASAFSFDEASHWNNYALTLPVSRRQLVTSRYVFSLLSILLVPLFLLLAVFIVTRINGADFSEAAVSFLFSTAATFFIISVSNAAIYCFGPERGRFVMFAVCVLPILAIATASRLLPQDALSALGSRFSLDLVTLDDSLRTVLWIGGICLLLGAVCLFVSYLFSCRIMERREF